MLRILSKQTFQEIFLRLFQRYCLLIERKLRRTSQNSYLLFQFSRIIRIHKDISRKHRLHTDVINPAHPPGPFFRQHKTGLIRLSRINPVQFLCHLSFSSCRRLYCVPHTELLPLVFTVFAEYLVLRNLCSLYYAFRANSIEVSPKNLL